MIVTIRRGFTLIELLVVIAIIALLSGVILASFKAARMKARDGQRIANAHQLGVALEQYETSNGTYKIANTGYQNTGSRYVGKSGVPDYSTSIISSLKSSGFYSSDILKDPVYGDDNYYLGICATTSAYTIFLKVEQPDLQTASTTLVNACDGATAQSLGFNYIAGAGGGGGTAGGGGLPAGPTMAYSKIGCTNCTLTNSWTLAPGNLPGGLGAGAIEVIGDYVYLFGGYNGTSFVDVIYRAPISNPTAWVNTGAKLPGAVGYAQSAIIGSYVYLFGGYRTSTWLRTIYRAPLSDPTAWVDTGALLPVNLGFSHFAVVGSYAYLFAGYANPHTSAIFRAPIADPTSWTDTLSDLPAAHGHGQIQTIGSYLYIFGGHNGANTVSTIFRASTTTPLSWSSVGNITSPRIYASSGIIGDYIYFFGGNDGTAYTNTIFRAGTATPTSWSNTGSTLPGLYGFTHFAVLGNYAYLFGGTKDGVYTNTILRAPVSYL